MRVFVILVLNMFMSMLFAQDNNWALFPSNQKSQSDESVGEIEIVQDKRINNLLEKDLKIKSETSKIAGYRVQIFFGSGSNVTKEANEQKTLFLTKYPNVGAYVVYDEPNWKTRVGDFRSKLEAEKFLLFIINDFPNSFVVKDEIELPVLN
jgi:hypothetical protein